MTFCAHAPASIPGHGAITITIAPNPIVARAVEGGMFEFPFDVVLRETGGHLLKVERVTSNVYAFGTVRVGSETYDEEKIRALGYPTKIEANGELRYHFNPRKQVPDERMLSNVSAEVRIDASDDTGTPASATTRVTVRR